MALEISTAGVLLKYCVETTAGTRPTSGYTTIPNIKSIPDLNPAPSNLDSTDLSDTEFKRSIEGLKDVGSSLAFGANITTAFKTAWETLISAYDTAFEAGKGTWFEVMVPNFGSFYFEGKPADLGLPAMDVDAVFSGDVYITPNTIAGWATSSQA